MIGFNILVIFLAALVPLVVGFIWYNPKVLGTAWMEASGMTPEKGKTGNMPLIFGLTYLFSVFLAFAMSTMVVHQFHLRSILMNEPGLNDPNSEVGMMVKAFMDKYGTNFRTFKHGMLHGFLGGVMIALPMIGVNALFEQRGFKYIAINVGYWVVSMTLMGGVICAFV
jgi:hypothetical protein